MYNDNKYLFLLYVKVYFSLCGMMYNDNICCNYIKKYNYNKYCHYTRKRIPQYMKVYNVKYSYLNKYNHIMIVENKDVQVHL